MKYKVIFITTSDLSGKSGHNIATNEIVEAFAINPEIDLILICPRPRSVFSDIITTNAYCIEFYNVLVPRMPLDLFPASTIVANHLIYTKVNKFLKMGINISFMVARLDTFFFSPVLIKKIKDIPYFLLIRGMPGKHLIKPLNAINQNCVEKNIELSVGIYVAYKKIKSTITKYIEPEKVKIFNNAVNPEKFKLLEKRISRETIGYNFQNTDFIIGFVGSIQGRHHIKELINAVENIYSNHSNNTTKKIKVLIVGDGPLLSKLKKYVNESNYINDSVVVFTGFVDHNKIGQYISACDVLYGVVSPNTPSNPIKCYEYLAAKRPIITTYIEDFSFVSEFNCGITLNSLNVKEISEAILNFYEKDEMELDNMGNNGRDYILMNHNWNDLPKVVINDFKNIS